MERILFSFVALMLTIAAGAQTLNVKVGRMVRTSREGLKMAMHSPNLSKMPRKNIEESHRKGTKTISLSKDRRVTMGRGLSIGHLGTMDRSLSRRPQRLQRRINNEAHRFYNWISMAKQDSSDSCPLTVGIL